MSDPLSDEQPGAVAGRVVEMAEHTTPNGMPPDEEVDLWWGSYHGRALVPGLLVCVMLTFAVILVAVSAWSTWGNRGLKGYWVREPAYGLIALLWFIQLCRWTYRLVSVTFRLTTHRLFHERGFQRAVLEVIPLTAIEELRVKQTAWERWLDIGRIRIVTSQPGSTATDLTGVFKPERIAILIRKAVRRRKAAEERGQ